MKKVTMPTATVQCINCANLDLQTFREHSKVGYGRCKFHAGGQFVSITYLRPGSRFKQAETEVIEARYVWARKLGLVEVAQ